MLTALTGCAVVAAVVVVVAQARGAVYAIIAGAIVTSCLLPIALTTQSPLFHVGIAGPTVEIRTYTLWFAAMALWMVLRHGRLAFSLSHFCFALWLTAGVAMWWHSDALLMAGVVQLATGAAAWMAGAGTGRTTTPPDFDRWLVRLLVAIVAIEVVVCVLQFGGVPINRLVVTESDILGSRVNGTANHPNNLGKLLICVLILLLPLTDSENKKNSELALVGCLAMFIPLGLAQGRANMAAFVSALVLWTLLSPAGRHSGRKLAIMAMTVAGVGLTATAIAARFEEDPEGGVRNEILHIALANIPHHLWTGVGPNRYVVEISSHFGSFIPVHNSLILLVAETGLIGAVLFLIPVVRAAMTSLRDCRTNPHARALVAVAPGLIAIAWTGWGLLGTSVLPITMFVVAYASSRTRQARVASGERFESNETDREGRADRRGREPRQVDLELATAGGPEEYPRKAG